MLYVNLQRAEKTNHQKVLNLLDCLKRKEDSFEPLCDALEATKQSRALKLLRSKEPSSEEVKPGTLPATHRRKLGRAQSESCLENERLSNNKVVKFQNVELRVVRLLEIYGDSTGLSDHDLLRELKKQECPPDLPSVTHEGGDTVNEQKKEAKEVTVAPFKLPVAVSRNYVPRHFKTSRKISTKVLTTTSNDIFILEGIRRYDFTSLCEKFGCQAGLSKNQFREDEIFVDKVILLEPDHSFNEFCKHYDKILEEKQSSIQNPNHSKRHNIHLLNCK